MTKGKMGISIDDLMGSDEETMGVYLIILYLRFHPWYRINLFNDSRTNPSEILSVYFSALSKEGLENVKNTMTEFHSRFEEALDALDSERKEGWRGNKVVKSLASNPPQKIPPKDKELWDRRLTAKKDWLEELEKRYFERFEEAFRGYVKLDAIPRDYRIFVKKFLQLVHLRVTGEEFTIAGSAKISPNQILLVAEELRGKKAGFIDILRESRIAFRGPQSIIASRGVLYESPSNIIIPSVAPLSVEL